MMTNQLPSVYRSSVDDIKLLQDVYKLKQIITVLQSTHKEVCHLAMGGREPYQSKEL